MNRVYTLEKIAEVADEFVRNLRDCRVIAINGNMGSGKTTFVHEVCKVLGVKGNVSSPTFSIIHQYEGVQEKLIYHIDLYRVKDEMEAIQAGVEDCLFSEGICFIEWPGIILHLLPPGYLQLDIQFIDENKRQIISKVQPESR